MLAFFLTVACLNTPEWERRDAATDKCVRLVNEMPWRYGPWAVAAFKASDSPETRARLRLAVLAYDRWRGDTYTPSTVTLWPICDAYPKAGYSVVCLCGCEIQYTSVVRDSGTIPTRGVGAGSPQWTQFRRGTEHWARNEIRQGRPAAEVDAILKQMAYLEATQPMSCEQPYVMPTRWAGGYLPIHP